MKTAVCPLCRGRGFVLQYPPEIFKEYGITDTRYYVTSSKRLEYHIKCPLCDGTKLVRDLVVTAFFLLYPDYPLLNVSDLPAEKIIKELRVLTE